MAVLTNPVNKSNIIARFADYVESSANAGIVWGTNNRPSIYFTSTYIGSEPFGGTTAGRPISISGADLTTTLASAGNIYSVLVAETQRYSNIRNLRAIVNVTGAGGNTPIGPVTNATGIIFNQVAKAHLSTSYRQATVSPSTAGVDPGSIIRNSNLESFFTNLQATYTTYRTGTLITIQANVCHSSCHSSCHGSRGRR